MVVCVQDKSIAKTFWHLDLCTFYLAHVFHSTSWKKAASFFKGLSHMGEEQLKAYYFNLFPATLFPPICISRKGSLSTVTLSLWQGESQICILRQLKAKDEPQQYSGGEINFRAILMRAPGKVSHHWPLEIQSKWIFFSSHTSYFNVPCSVQPYVCSEEHSTVATKYHSFCKPSL